jgi:Trk K+ transport system NAD-binding subunit
VILSRSGTVRIEFEVLESDREILGRVLDALVVPHGVRLVQLNRGLRSFAPDSGTTIRTGDVLVFLADLDEEPALRTWILDEAGRSDGGKLRPT